MARILLVEDDPILLQLYKDKLSLSGFDVVTAVDGEDALDKVKSTNPQLVLLDIMIPKKNGFEVLDAIKHDPNTQKIPVIILTNLKNERDAEEALDRGALQYVTKSDYEPKDIVKMVNDALTSQSS